MFYSVRTWFISSIPIARSKCKPRFVGIWAFLFALHKFKKPLLPQIALPVYFGGILL